MFVLFGIVLGNFGVDYVLDVFSNYVFEFKVYLIENCLVEVIEEGFIGFVFKI